MASLIRKFKFIKTLLLKFLYITVFLSDFIVINRSFYIGVSFLLDKFIKSHIVLFKIWQFIPCFLFLFFTVLFWVVVKAIASSCAYHLINIFSYDFIHDQTFLSFVFLFRIVDFSHRFSFVCLKISKFLDFVRLFDEIINFAAVHFFFWWRFFDSVLQRWCKGSTSWKIKRSSISWTLAGESWTFRWAWWVAIDQRELIFNFFL